MRRKRMHGKRRRRSSSAPFKHKEGSMAAHSYMSEDKYHGATTQEPNTTRVDTGLASDFKQINIDDDLSEKYEKQADVSKNNKEREFIRSWKEGGGDKQSKRDEEKDSLGENIVEIFDPTGVSSWDDAARAYNKEEWGFDEYLDMASVIPFAGRLTKVLKGARTGINLAKKTFSASRTAADALDAYESASDIYHDNIKGGVGGGGGGKNKSKTRSSGWSYYGGIK